MKAVRGAQGGVVVVDVEEPPGTGELLTMKAASICSSDLMYIDFGFRKILGHELAGVREDGTARVVEALYGCMECDERRRGRYNLCASGGAPRAGRLLRRRHRGGRHGGGAGLGEPYDGD